MPLELLILGVPGDLHSPPGSQPPSRTPSPLAGGCASLGASSYGRGKREAERLYFNTPLWVGDLEKQLGESKSVKSNLPRCR